MVAFRKIAWLATAFVSGGISCMGIQKISQELGGVDSGVLEAAGPTDVTNRPNEIMKFGFPSNSNVNIRKNYVFGYDNRLRNASWVFEHINKDLLLDSEKSDRENSHFFKDSSIHPFFRATNKDFFNSGYDRGHLAAAANHRASQMWMDDTFSLSNIIPQNPSMNRQAWNNLEKYVRSLVFHNDNVYVCTGPLYLPKRDAEGKLHIAYEVIGNNHVAVPTHLFKVVVCERNSQFELLSYVMPNAYVDPNIPLPQFLCPVEVIERASGLIFFDRIRRDRFRRINGGKESIL